MSEQPFQRRWAIRRDAIPNPAVTRRFRCGLMFGLIVELLAIAVLVIGLWMLFNALTLYEPLSASPRLLLSGASGVLTQTPTATIAPSATPSPQQTGTTSTRRPTRTPTPSPTLTPKLISAGWMNWWGEEGDLADRRVYVKGGDLAPGSPVWVCSTGETASARIQDMYRIGEWRCTDGYIAASARRPAALGKHGSYSTPLPAPGVPPASRDTGGEMLIGSIGAGIRHDLIGSVSVVWPLTNVAVFMFGVPPGHEVIERGRG